MDKKEYTDFITAKAYESLTIAGHENTRYHNELKRNAHILSFENVNQIINDETHKNDPIQGGNMTGLDSIESKRCIASQIKQKLIADIAKEYSPELSNEFEAKKEEFNAAFNKMAAKHEADVNIVLTKILDATDLSEDSSNDSNALKAILDARIKFSKTV